MKKLSIAAKLVISAVILPAVVVTYVFGSSAADNSRSLSEVRAAAAKSYNLAVHDVNSKIKDRTWEGALFFDRGAEAFRPDADTANTFKLMYRDCRTTDDKKTCDAGLSAYSKGYTYAKTHN